MSTQKPQEYIKMMRQVGQEGDLFCLLESRKVLRRPIFLLQLKVLPGDKVHVDDTPYIGFHQQNNALLVGNLENQYYPLMMVMASSMSLSLVLNSDSGRQYQVGFMQKDGNSLFRTLVSLCKQHNITWKPTITSQPDGSLQFQNDMKNPCQNWKPLTTVLVGDGLNALYFAHQWYNHQIRLFLVNIGDKSCTTKFLDEILHTVTSVAEYVPDANFATQIKLFEMKFLKLGFKSQSPENSQRPVIPDGFANDFIFDDGTCDIFCKRNVRQIDGASVKYALANAAYNTTNIRMDKFRNEMTEGTLEALITPNFELQTHHIAVWLNLVCEICPGFRPVSSDLMAAFAAKRQLSEKNAMKFIDNLEQGLLLGQSILVPVCKDCHWFLIVVHVKELCFRIYDSMCPETIINRFFQEDKSLQNLITKRIPGNWKIEMGKSPQQNNLVDCGVYVCINAMYAASNSERWPIMPHHIDQIRLLLAHLILNQERTIKRYGFSRLYSFSLYLLSIFSLKAYKILSLFLSQRRANHFCA